MSYPITGIMTYANQPQTTVSTGGTDAPAQGTSEQWTVASGATFPIASQVSVPATTFAVADTAATSEIIWVTAATTSTPWIWGVTRGAEGTSPVTHATNFTVQQVVTAGGLQNFKQASNAVIVPVTVATTVAATIATFQPIASDIVAGSTFEAIAYGTFVTNNTTARCQMTWQLRWGSTVLNEILTNSNAPSLASTTSVAGSSFDFNGTITLLSSTQATCNANLFYTNSSNSLITTASDATATNATAGTASQSAPVTISGSGPIVLTFAWSATAATTALIAVAPVIYRVA